MSNVILVFDRNKGLEEEQVDPRLPPPSTYLLQAQPKRGIKKSKTHVKTNLYVLVDFGLQVAYVFN